MSRTGNDDESFAIGWISISDLLMLGTLSLFLISSGLEIQTDKQSKRIDEMSLDASEKDSAIKNIATKLDEMTSEKDQLQTQLLDTEWDLSVLDCVNSDLKLHLEDALESVDDLTTKKMNLEHELQESRTNIRMIEIKLTTANTQISELTVMLETEQWKTVKLLKTVKNFERDLKAKTDELMRVNQSLASTLNKLKDAQALNGILQIKNTILDDKLSLTMINERGFRQELLGIRARNNRLGRVVFVVDRSGSMGTPTNSGSNSRWEYVRNVIESWLLLLPCEEAQLVLFNDKEPKDNDPGVEVYPQSENFVAFPDDQTKRRNEVQKFVEVLRRTTPIGGTNTRLALEEAYKNKDVDAIFLFTDGQPALKPPELMSSAEFKELQDGVLNLVQKHSMGDQRIPINVIGLGDYFSTKASKENPVHLPFGVFLVKIAEISGGVFLGR